MKQRFLSITALFFVGTLFFLRGLFVLDPDFGWHLRMGEVILQSGIPRTDPFSYTMPSYPFVDHEWLTNVGITILYRHIGIAGLSILFSLITLVALGIQTNFFKTTQSKLFFLLSAMTFLSFAGVRTQVITWFFFSLFLFILYAKSHWHKFRWWLPVLMVFWVNLHGGFPLGLVALSVVLLTRFYQQKKISISDVFLFLLCFLATFINPYGYRIWWEVWMQMSDHLLRWTISEWTPTLMNSLSISLFAFLSISVSLLILYRKRFPLEQLLISAGLLFAAFSSIRHIPLFVLAVVPMLIQSFSWIKQQALQYKHGEKRFAILARYGVFGIGILVIVQTGFFSKDLYAAYSRQTYPAQAIKFLQSHPTSGNVFSIYNWGGYLIWKFPEKKVFMDGRMPSWRWKAPHDESNYAFEDQMKIGTGKLPVKQVIAKYSITAFLLPKESKTMQSKNKKYFYFYNTLEERILGKQKKPIDLRKEIQRLGFTKVYEDNVASVYMQ